MRRDLKPNEQKTYDDLIQDINDYIDSEDIQIMLISKLDTLVDEIIENEDKISWKSHYILN